ncbi:alpha/beta-hydrolase [Trametopsis cervina]|nr:alpha/beta-hydrolase [Trametopsis cervina]
MHSFSAFLSLSALLAVAVAAPAPVPIFGIHIGSADEANGTPVSVSQTDVTKNLQRPADFARVAYCSPTSVTALSCGGPCDAVKTIKVLASGGDEGATPRFFVAQDPDTQSIVVAHQGTDPDKLLSIANDVKFGQVAMNSTLFPSPANGSEVHVGFQETQGRTADIVLSTVKSALASTGFKRVLTTGHSLGAAVATLDAVMLRMQLGSDVQVNSVVFGLPRVGNNQFADMVDAIIPGFTHVSNQHDPVPDVPPHFLAFQHPGGEIHITAVDNSTGLATLEACPGQENQNCAAGNSLLDTSIPDHLGPYFNGIEFGGHACPA